MSPFDALIAQRVQAALSCFDASQAMPNPGAANPCTIVVPIFNAAEHVRRCLASLLLYVEPRHTILLADDCSTDANLAAELLAFSSEHRHVKYIRRDKNLGYLDNVNAALASTTGDVVLLNSDTEIGPTFIERLQRAAYCRAKIAAACPLSDNATLLSIAESSWLAQFSTVQIQDALASCARLDFPSLPTVVGFCVYLRRDALDALGFFDRFFSPGYGEEDDFAQRARSAGWALVAAPDVFVRHASGKSFGRGAEVAALQRKHAARLAWRWPSYESDVRTWWRDWPLREQAERLRRELLDVQAAEDKSIRENRKPRILHVLHRLTRVGGTENVARSLVDAFSAQAEQTIVAVDPLSGAWCDALESQLENGTRLLMFNRANVQANQKIAGLPADLSDPALERSFARLLSGGSFDVVHIHHLAGWNTLLLPTIARALGVPVVLGLHCHFALCPDSEMVHSPSQSACEKIGALGDLQCTACIANRQVSRLGAAKLPISSYLDARSAFWRRLIADCDVLISPSHYLASRIAANFPESPGKMHLIAHGLPARELDAAANSARRWRPKARLQVGFLGGDGPRKGFALLKEIALQTQHLPIQFTAFGVSNHHLNLPNNLAAHPAFAPKNRTKHLIDLDLILLPSMMSETFSLVLSEAHAHAIPVIASNRGAFSERVQHGVDSWCLDVTDVGKWVDYLTDFCTPSGRKKLLSARRHLLKKPQLSLETQAEIYWRIYQDLWVLKAPLNSTKASFARLSSDPASLRLRQSLPAARRLHPLEFVQPADTRKLPQIVAIARDLWAQSQYRVHLPLAALAESSRIAPPAIWCARHDALPAPEEILALEPCCVAFLHGLDPPTFALIKSLNTDPNRPRLVFLLDDLIFAQQTALSDAKRSAMQALLRDAINMCDVCICTTNALASALRDVLQIAPNKLLTIENALPKAAWQAPVRRPIVNSRLRVLWAGAAQHQADVDLLLPVISITKLRYQWVFFGLCPTGLALDPDIEFHPAVEFADYAAKLAALQADIALAPLCDSDFNRCKSPLKLLEYSAQNLPVIASKLTPYLAAPILHADSVKTWLSALSALECASYRSACAQSLRIWAQANHCLTSETIQAAWLEGFL